MQLTNSISEYGLVSKLFHWLTFVALLIQIPMGFYLVDLDYSDYRIFIEDIHVTLGLSIFYLVLFRLLYKFINPTPALPPAIFSGQKVIAKLNHFALYITLLSVTISGTLKKLFNGESLNFLFKIKLKSDFDKADFFYDIHIYSNYTLIALISLHVFAVIIHRVLFNMDLFQTSFCLPIGKLRILLPVAAKIALVIAGSMGKVAGSPVPVGSDLLSKIVIFISGVSRIRAIR